MQGLHATSAVTFRFVRRAFSAGDFFHPGHPGEVHLGVSAKQIHCNTSPVGKCLQVDGSFVVRTSVRIAGEMPYTCGVHSHGIIVCRRSISFVFAVLFLPQASKFVATNLHMVRAVEPLIRLFYYTSHLERRGTN